MQDYISDNSNERQFLGTMLHFYIGVIRPVWHTGLTADLSDQLETMQKRALRITFGGSTFIHQSYESFCFYLEIVPLSARKDQLATRIFINS